MLFKPTLLLALTATFLITSAATVDNASVKRQSSEYHACGNVNDDNNIAQYLNGGWNCNAISDYLGPVKSVWVGDGCTCVFYANEGCTGSVGSFSSKQGGKTTDVTKSYICFTAYDLAHPPKA